MSNILISPITELILVGTPTGIAGVFTMPGRQVFFTEAVTHATFPGAIVGVVVAATLGLSRSWISVSLFTGVLLICIPIGTLFSLSRVGTTSSTAGIVSTFESALGYFLNKWPAPSPVKIEGSLVGSVLNVNKTNTALSGGLLLSVAAVLAARWRRLIYSTFDPESSGIAHSRGKAQLVASRLTVLVLVALIPAVGTTPFIMLLTAFAAALVRVTNDTHLLFVLAPSTGIATGLVGLFITVAADLLAGSYIGACTGCFYVPFKVAAIRNDARI